MELTRARVAAALCALLVPACSSTGTKSEPMTFKTPDEAVTAIVAAARAEDMSRLEVILGPDCDDILNSGDDVADRAGRKRFVELYDQKHRLETTGDGMRCLVVGDEDWPMPIPIVSDGDAWVFDADAGREELLNRRIGRNELSTIQVCLALVDAQQEYATADRDQNGLLEYAQTFRSTAGKQDGLYWPTKEGEPPSPLGPLAAQAVKQGYGGRAASEGPIPYFGYYYRILKSQGPHAPGGEYDYCVRDRMIGGFAIIAYPAEYCVSGVKSFIVSHDAIVFEKDLGKETEKAASSLSQYDPDETWAPVKS